MANKLMIPNPHHDGAPNRMADGRLFTDYRASCALLPPLVKGTMNPDHERRQAMLQNGVTTINADRSVAVLRGGSTGCVDTMVPELVKRSYTWQGPTVVPCQAVGIGTGRMYLPGLAFACTEPDALAAATFPELAGTHSANRQLYVAAPLTSIDRRSAMPATYNRYSAPYGQ
jgi:hypothetical protein